MAPLIPSIFVPSTEAIDILARIRVEGRKQCCRGSGERMKGDGDTSKQEAAVTPQGGDRSRGSFIQFGGRYALKAQATTATNP